MTDTNHDIVPTLRMFNGLLMSQAADEIERLRELLSSARAIAQRKGEGTAWERFDASIAKCGISGVTARTYRVLPSDVTPDQAPAVQAGARERFTPIGRCTCAGPDGPCETCVSNREAYEGWVAERQALATTPAQVEQADAARLIEALQTIVDWRLPPTGEFWDAEKTRPVSYEAQFGSNGARDYMRGIARAAIAARKEAQ